MPNTTYSFGSEAYNTGDGTGFQSISNVLSEPNTARASVTSKNTSLVTKEIRVTGFGGVPANAKILGIEVHVRGGGAASGGAAMDVRQQLVYDGALIGNSQPNQSWPTSITDHHYGGPADLWGVTNLTAEMVNSSSFGHQSKYSVTAAGVFSIPIFDIQFVKMRLTYATDDGAYVRSGGVWVATTGLVKDSGVWKSADKYLKDLGVWKR